MFHGRFTLMMILLVAQALSGLRAGYIGGEIAAGVHSAGLLGNYAGALSGGEALAKLDLGANDHDHDQDHEQLGALGEHLNGDSFPADYGSSGSSDAGVEYAEASEQHSLHYEPEPELELEHQEHGEQPVPGIDHGKGAFSYSTLYEFKDREEHEHNQLKHQLEEEHIEQQLELEHQQHIYEHQLDSH